MLGICTELWHNAYWSSLNVHDLLLFRAAAIDWQRGRLREAFYSPEAGNLCRLADVQLPQVIFDYSLFLNEAAHQRLRQLGVCCVFNHFGAPFDKWSLHRRLASCSRLSSALPETRLYSSLEDVMLLLRDYQAVLLKPLSLSRGRGIVLLPREQVLKSAWRSQLLADTAYLVQRRVELITLQGRTTDFRFYVQRNEYGLWQVSAAAARQSAVVKQLLTNLALGAQSLSAQAALQNQDNYLLRRAAPLYWEKMCALALLTARQVEKSYYMADQGWQIGELGIDIGLDQLGQVWLLEVNSKPGKTCLRYDQQVMRQVVCRPLKFARYLQKSLA